MLVLCSMLSVTNYAQNYAGIIGWSLTVVIGIQASSGCWSPRHTSIVVCALEGKIAS